MIYLYLVRKKEVNFILSYYTNLSHTGQEKITSFFRTRYTSNRELRRDKAFARCVGAPPMLEEYF